MNFSKKEKSALRMSIIALCGLLCLSVLPAAFAAQQAPPAKVKLGRVIEQDGQKKTELVGIVYFDKVSDVSTEIGGLVSSIHFREGDKVKKGDVLVRLNTDFLEKDLALEQINLQRVEIRIEQKQKNLNRFEELYKKEAASEVDYEDFSFSHRELVKEKESLRIKIERIRLEIAKSAIRAPFDGIVMQKRADRGAWIQKGDPICRIGSTHDLFVQLPVSEKLLKFAKSGDSIDLIINAFDRRLTGKIDGIRPIADEKTKNIFLKIRLPDMDVAVENMSATVFMPTSAPMRLKMIPRDALVKFKGKNFVYTVKDNQAKLLPLDIVTMSGIHVGVDSPHLRDGMPIVVDGNERLKPDQAVVIVGEN